MADFDDAERHALHEVEPIDQLRWLLEEVDEDLTFFGWLPTQVAPPPGVPQLRCDCVAGLRSASGTQPPWACLIEAQGQSLAGMAVWMLIYLGLLHNLLRYEGRDRYQMMGVILNLSEGELSHTIDWRVPLKRKPAAADVAQAASVPAPEGGTEGGPECPQADVTQSASVPPAPEGDLEGGPECPQADVTQAAPVPPAPGVSCVFFIKNVRKESAEQTLTRIDLGELGLCILVWVPLMAGADDPNVIRRWRDLAMRQNQLHLRADYVALALVFAEMAGRKGLWQSELETFNMQESTIMRGWRQEGVKEGLEKGALTTTRAAVMKVLQTRFPGIPVPEGVRSALEQNADIQQLGDWLSAAVLTASPADFERFLAAAAN